MKKIVKYTSFVIALMALVTGCDGKQTEDSTSSTAETVVTTSVEETTTTSIETTTEFTETTTETTSEISDENNTEYRTVLDAYHQAYIDGNADAVYALFSPNEITAFDTYMKAYLKDSLGESEETVEKMFTKDNIISAINVSIQNICSEQLFLLLYLANKVLSIKIRTFFLNIFSTNSCIAHEIHVIMDKIV